MKTYLKRLSNHPGVELAALFTAMFLLAGLSRADSAWQVGIVPSVVVWAVVLWTARTQPLPSRYSDKKAESIEQETEQ
jgi:hypothetical protein